VLVWLTNERCHGYLVGPLGAHVSLVKYTKGGIEYEVYIDTDEIEEVEIDWESINEYDDSDE
jgi:hypothetical protein